MATHHSGHRTQPQRGIDVRYADHDFRAIAPDLRGYGHSTLATLAAGATCLQSFARDLRP